MVIILHTFLKSLKTQMCFCAFVFAERRIASVLIWCEYLKQHLALSAASLITATAIKTAGTELI